MQRPQRVVLAVSALTLLAAGCGSTDNGAVDAVPTNGGTPRTVEIEMRDIAYVPTSVDVKRGETVRFVFTNKGAVTHDAFIGDEAAQADHEMQMRNMGSTSTSMGNMGSTSTSMGNMGSTSTSMGNTGSTSTSITVAPGETGELTYTFDGTGEVLIGCHQAGHYEAGMKLALNVS